MGIFDLVRFPWSNRSQHDAIRHNSDDPRNEPYCQPQTYDNTQRFYPQNGSIVYGYPSSGGILARSAKPVEIAYLGLDRFTDAKRATNLDEEDEFCERLGKIGAQWWESREAYVDAQLGECDDATKRRLAKRVETGWPSSGHGVWVLVHDRSDPNQHEVIRGASRLKNCLNMDERCRIIEELGGTFYPVPNNCPALHPLT